jgi:hypothetical protein
MSVNRIAVRAPLTRDLYWRRGSSWQQQASRRIFV